MAFEPNDRLPIEDPIAEGIVVPDEGEVKEEDSEKE